MTKLLEKAIERATRMTEKEQNEIAAFIMDEVAWDEKLESSKDQLVRLANSALNENKLNKTTDLQF